MRERRRCWLGAAAVATAFEVASGLDAAAEVASVEAEPPDDAPTAFPTWLPQVDLEDLDCRRPMESRVAAWSELRELFRELAEGSLHPQTLGVVAEDEEAERRRKALQMDILSRAAVVLLRFHAAIMECPLGTVTASLFVLMLAHMPREDASIGTLPAPYELLLADLARRPFIEHAARDLRLLLDIAPLHVTAASEWSVFPVLHLYLGRTTWLHPPVPAAVETLGRTSLACAGTTVSGIPSEDILTIVRRHIPFASGKDILGLKFLRGMDPLVTKIMKDPSDFSQNYLHACPAGAAAFSVTAAMLALMSNPSLFEQFSYLANFVLSTHTEEVLAGASTWGVFYALTKLQKFATRAFDLVWSTSELLSLPADPTEFDSIRLDSAMRASRLEAASASHPHPPTRELAGFLRRVALHQEEQGEHSEVVVYLTAVGGQPFSDHISGFLHRALDVRLSGLIVQCMDTEALTECSAVVDKDRMPLVLCVPALEGHVVLIKHAFIPAILSAGIDTVWIDFDTFIFRDPTADILLSRDQPSRVLPQRERIRYGSFLFENATEMCAVTKICDNRQHWYFNISSDFDESSVSAVPADDGVEMLVTEHWDARCLNNGLFYVKATHRPLFFFVTFVRQLYINPYTDNQNLFDAFLAHSTFDTAAPKSRPILNYALFDIERIFACAEGHRGSLSTLATFHFWSSDFRTREASEDEEEALASAEPAEAGAAIRTRDGVQRVAKMRMTKAELFEVFFGGGSSAGVDFGGVPPFPAAAARFLEQVVAPPPRWKGMCSVTAVGVEELVDERLLQGENTLVDWDDATRVAAAADGAVPEEAGDAVVPLCSGIPLKAWSDAIRTIADLEAVQLLPAVAAEKVKAELRRLNVGYLLTLQAFLDQGPERLIHELLRAVASDQQFGGRLAVVPAALAAEGAAGHGSADHSEPLR